MDNSHSETRENIIVINNLVKSFGEIKAVQDISFKVKKGELFAFLGVNGAGKSTTISIMCGQLPKDSGTITIDGQDLESSADNIKQELGVVFQNSLLDTVLSVRDNLKIKATLYGITGEQFNKRLQELDEMLSLKEILNRPVGKLSGGQRRRADIARALINSPKILILDEPTTGLDPLTRQTVWKVINKLRKTENTTVLLTTHYMEEATDASYVVIIDSGKIVAKGTPIELKNKYTGDFITLYNTDENSIKSLNLPYEKIDNAFRVAVKSTKDATDCILANPDLFVDYEVNMGRMDDVFLSVTGKKLIGDEK